MALEKGYDVTALSVWYGQKHAHELQCAKRIAKHFKVEHVVSDVDLRSIGGSALTSDMQIPVMREIHELATEIPVTYVPARNTVFLSIALAWAEVLDAEAIFIGVNAVDYSGYPDCRPQFIEAFQAMANLATKRAVEGKQTRIVAPLLHMKKREIIQHGLDLGVDYSMTSSCYQPFPNTLPALSSVTWYACGTCDACVLRKAGFEELNRVDPVLG